MYIYIWTLNTKQTKYIWEVSNSNNYNIRHWPDGVARTVKEAHNFLL